jgi:hypothetical protein
MPATCMRCNFIECFIADCSCLQLQSADSAKRSPYFKRPLSAQVADFSCRQLKSAVVFFVPFVDFNTFF